MTREWNTGAAGGRGGSGIARPRGGGSGAAASRGGGSGRVRSRGRGIVRALAAVGLCACFALSAAAPAADAFWSDTAPVEVATPLAGLPEAPRQAGTAAGLGCAVSNPVLGPKSMTYSWEKRTWRGKPLVYSATASVTNSGATVAHALALESNGGQVVLTSGLLTDLLGALGDLLGGLQLVKTSTITVTVEARYAEGGNWVSSTSGGGQYFTSILGLLGTFTCT